MATVSGNIRQEVNKTRAASVGASAARPAAETRAPAPANRNPANPTTETQAPAQTNQQVNPEDNFSVNHDPEQRRDFLINKPGRTREENEELEQLNKQLDKKIGNIKKAKDKKEKEADLEPIKIEEGDIIKYMMKEIVLASAGWAGGKVCGFAGYYMIYRPASWGYHYFFDKDKEGAKATGKSENEAYKKFEIKDSDDKTTSFTKTMGYRHALQKEKIDQEAHRNAYNLQTLLNAAIDNKLGDPVRLIDPATKQEKEYTSLADAVETVSLAQPQQTTDLLQRFNQLAQNNPNRLDELRQQAHQSAQVMINHLAAQKLFEEQYARAMMIQNMQRDPAYLGIQDHKKLTQEENQRIAQEKERHKTNARHLFGKMYTEYFRDPPTALTQKLHDQYPSFTEFAGLPAEALEHAQQTTEKGRYVEKGKNPEEKTTVLRKIKEKPNEALDHLNELMGIKRPDRSNTQQQSMSQAAQTVSHLETEDIDRNITALEAELANNDEKRKRLQKVKSKAKDKSPQKETYSPSLNTIHANQVQR